MANVTPSYDQNGKVIGYLSVRRKPRPEIVPVVADLYRAMLAEEAGAGARDAMAALGSAAEQNTCGDLLALNAAIEAARAGEALRWWRTR